MSAAGDLQKIMEAIDKEIGDIEPGMERTLKLIGALGKRLALAVSDKEKLFWRSMMDALDNKTGCCCGERHEVTPNLAVVLTQVKELGEAIEISTLGGSWKVPRVYIAVHGLKAHEVGVLAKKYGWKEA